MKRFSSAASLALAVVAVLGLAGPVAAQVPVPFSGRLAGVDIGTPQVPPLVSVQVKATGIATQLGKFTYLGRLTVNRATRTAIGTYEFTAANGDTVYAEFTGVSTPTAIPGVLYIEETATITGGTGRFAGATGIFSVERWYDMVAGTTIGSFEGTISSPGN